MRPTALYLVVTAFILSACANGFSNKQASAPDAGHRGDAAAISRVLDNLHDAASKADEARYFSLFYPGGVFLGTDATERWTIPQFREYAHARFATGRGWTYTLVERHIDFSPDGDAAWFDELLNNSRYGLCRGTGVLLRDGSTWKIAQYHLTIPVPNDIAEDVANQIKAR